MCFFVGTLTAQEIQDALNLSAEEVNEMIAEVDTDGDGTLSYEEFLAVFCNSEKFNGTEFNLHDPSTSN